MLKIWTTQLSDDSPMLVMVKLFDKFGAVETCCDDTHAENDAGIFISANVSSYAGELETYCFQRSSYTLSLSLSLSLSHTHTYTHTVTRQDESLTAQTDADPTTRFLFSTTLLII